MYNYNSNSNNNNHNHNNNNLSVVCIFSTVMLIGDNVNKYLNISNRT